MQNYPLNHLCLHHHKIRREKWLATASQVGMNEIDSTRHIGSPNHVRFDPASDQIADSGLGLLISVSVLLLDRYVPGDWF